MQLFKQSSKKEAGRKVPTGTQNSKQKKALSSKRQLKQVMQLVTRYQIVIIIVFVTGLLAITALRMLRYSDPAPDEQRTQENLSKIKQIHLDAKAVERIKQLSDSQTSTGSNLQNNRSNPFSE